LPEITAAPSSTRKEYPWLKPADGARSAAFSNRSAVPGASGSPVNARTILRRLMTSVNSTPEA